jgi:plastocyanin
MTGPSLVDAPSESVPPESGVRPWTIGLALMIVVVIGTAFALVVALGGGDELPALPTAEHEITYLVPRGTGARIDAGEAVEIIPSELTLRVTDTLVLVNDDDRTHNVGGYQVRAGDTLRISYNRPGLYMNACSVNSGDLVTITVVA